VSGGAEEGEGFDKNSLLSVEEIKLFINSSLRFLDDILSFGMMGA
jgi:hypothetical protein